MPEIPLQYFLKELPENPLYLPTGQKVPWEIVDSDTGILATQDAGLIFQLANCVSQRRGGVVKIEQGRYEELLKKKPEGTSSLPPPERSSLPQAPLRVAESPLPKAQPPPVVESPNAAVVAANPTPPPDAPPAQVKPPRDAVKRGRAKVPVAPSVPTP